MSTVSPAASVTIGELRRQAVAHLKAAGIEQAVLEADWLLEFALEVPRQVLVINGAASVSPAQFERAWSYLDRRAQREPLQYLLGTQEFRGLEFTVTPAVLIPRPETELLVEAALRAVSDIPRPVIADVGTGSGCIAVSIARERSDARILASDLSAAALKVARANAAAHGVLDRITFVQANLVDAVSDGAIVDVVVSNPPYIPLDEVDDLQPEVSRYEPRLALAAGNDGLAAIRCLLHQATDVLKCGGSLILEMGAGQADRVSELARERGVFDAVECRNDSAGIPRVLIARKSIKEF